MDDYLPPDEDTRRNVLWLRRFFAHHGPPDVTASDNGTVYLEWGDWAAEHVMVEIGTSKVGILVRPKGGLSWYVNGRRADVQR